MLGPVRGNSVPAIPIPICPTSSFHCKRLAGTGDFSDARPASPPSGREPDHRHRTRTAVSARWNTEVVERIARLLEKTPLNGSQPPIPRAHLMRTLTNFPRLVTIPPGRDSSVPKIRDRITSSARPDETWNCFSRGYHHIRNRDGVQLHPGSGHPYQESRESAGS